MIICKSQTKNECEETGEKKGEVLALIFEQKKALTRFRAILFF